VPIPALGDFFRIIRSFNTGAAFGIFAEASDIFLVIAVVVVVVMLFFYPRIPRGQWLLRFGMGLIVGGAVGNAIDRLIYGHVVDFINYRIPNVLSNVSNLADHAITIGVILILIDNILQERRERRQKQQAASTLPESSTDADPTP
jgi:signal peptidase II